MAHHMSFEDMLERTQVFMTSLKQHYDSFDGGWGAGNDVYDGEWEDCTRCSVDGEVHCEADGLSYVPPDAALVYEPIWGNDYLAGAEHLQGEPQCIP